MNEGVFDAPEPTDPKSVPGVSRSPNPDFGWEGNSRFERGGSKAGVGFAGGFAKLPWDSREEAMGGAPNRVSLDGGFGVRGADALGTLAAAGLTAVSGEGK